MNAQETLAQIDHIMTEVDLVVYEWQEAVDMMSFIGYNASFELWTNDDPPRLVTRDVLAQAAGKELRVMHRIEGKWTPIGSAVVDKNGQVQVSITKDVPELTAGVMDAFSIDRHGGVHPLPREHGALAHFEIDEKGNVKKGVDWDIDNNIPLKDNPYWNPPFEGFENHPFFRTQSEPDTHEDRGN